MASQATTVWQTTVNATYQMFGLHDPTCEEMENFDAAVSAAIHDVVGWAPNAAMVQVTNDLVPIDVQVEVFDGTPPVDDSAELRRDGRLEVPGGMVSVPKSEEGQFRLGVDLPDGAGTYGVRVCGYGRARARRIREDGGGRGDAAEFDAMVESLVGVERYRVSLWRVSSEPRWQDD